ncbi:MAG: PorV/PorQ family protein [Elusimicrobia bacterium]|nr:PorV/PorQ family protein [Elusimicrobiota bacterium]
MRALAVVTAFGIAALVPLEAKETAGTFAGTFLLVPTGVRSMGMGDTGVALAYGSNGSIYNPATVARSNYSDVAFSQQNLLTDSTLAFLGYAQPLDFRGFSELGGVSIFTTLRHVDHGKIEANYLKPDGSLDRTETLTAGRDIAWSFGYAEYFLKGGFGDGAFSEGIHSLGMTLTAINSELAGQYEANAVGVSLGYLGNFEKLSLGLSLANFGTGLKYIQDSDPLPLVARAGAAYPFQITEYIRLLFAYDLVHEERSFHQRGGAELNIGKLFALRGGWRLERESFRGGPTFGFGLDTGRFFADYAFGWYGDLEETHRMLVGFRFSHHPFHYH